jgi:hypothetical protein
MAPFSILGLAALREHRGLSWSAPDARYDTVLSAYYGELNRLRRHREHWGTTGCCSSTSSRSSAATRSSLRQPLEDVRMPERLGGMDNPGQDRLEFLGG